MGHNTWNRLLRLCTVEDRGGKRPTWRLATTFNTAFLSDHFNDGLRVETLFAIAWLRAPQVRLPTNRVPFSSEGSLLCSEYVMHRSGTRPAHPYPSLAGRPSGQPASQHGEDERSGPRQAGQASSTERQF